MQSSRRFISDVGRLSSEGQNTENKRFNLGLYISSSHSRCSIFLSNVFKTHQNNNVFNGLNLIAHSGKIHAILGEKQSGKSMLLSCLVGGEKVDKGQIWVLGGKPRTKSSRTLTMHVGYMPQEFCLCEMMTVQELLAYFGQIYDINYKFILWRISYYNDIFTLPPTNVPVKNLSFSQKRMVSFIISVFHRPRLVVLDEPTVGLDVFKKKQIWKYLNFIISTWKPTVIVATNNIEEAFLASKISYLKNGQIIFVKEVEELLRINPNKSIDIIIDNICSNINNDLSENNSVESNEIIKPPHDKKLRFFKLIKPRSNVWKLKTIIVHKIKFLTKNVWKFFLTCVIPLLHVLMHCTYYGKYPNPIPIAVYNQETDCVYNPCKQIENCTYFSCHFLNLLNKNKIEAEYYDYEPLARDSVIKRLNLGFVNVPKNYTEAIVKSITQRSPNKRNELSKSSIYIEIDMSTYEFGKHLNLNLRNAHESHLTSIYVYYNLSTKYANIPFEIYEQYNLDLTENTVSEIISWAIFSSAMFFSSLLMHVEIKNGWLKRNMIAGITIFEIISSFICIQTVVSICQAFLFYFLADFLLFIKWHMSLLLIVLLDISIGICGMSIGLFIGSFSNSLSRVYHVTLAMSIINIILSGIFWPLDNMHWILKPISVVTPLSMPIRAVKNVMIQGRKLKTFEILYATISISCWTIVSLVASILKIK